MVNTVSDDAHGVKPVGNILNLFRFLINYNDIVLFVAKLLYKRITYFATANDNNVHNNLLGENIKICGRRV